jgi:hypothetical protein
MEYFYWPANRERIASIFGRLDIATGTNLATRYREWLEIMDATHASYRREVPKGISDCVSYLVKKSDVERWLETEDLYAERPDYKLYRSQEDLAEYNCGIAYYFTRRSEVKSIIRRSDKILNTAPEDRFAGTKNPYEHLHIEFSPERQTARMVVDAKLPQNTEMLRHKMSIYDRIIVSVAIQTLGMEAMPVLDEVLFEKYDSKGNLQDVKKLVENALKHLEHEQCQRRGIEWTDKRPESKYW